MLPKNNEWNREDAILYLQEVDAGYAPTKKELLKLSKITRIVGTEFLNVSVLPNSLKMLSNLKVLDLSWSAVSDISVLSNLINLQELDLTNSCVANIDALSNLTKLTVLNLNDNQITDIDALITLKNLQELNLSDTEVKNIGVLASLSSLSALDLSDIQIEDTETLSGLTNLRELDLSNTQITNVDFLSNFSNLQNLNLSNNPIQNIDSLHNLTNLHILDLCNTQINAIDVLNQLTNLSILDLSGTQIEKATFLSSLINLYELDLSNTQIANIDFLSNLLGLHILKTRNAPITSIDVLHNLTNLHELDLSNTQITNIEALSALTNLHELDLSDTEIEKIDALSSLRDLQELNLRGTHISQIDSLSQLTNLQELNLSATQIKNVDALSSLSNLRILSLTKSTVANIDGLSQLINLDSLFLGGTQITNIDSLSSLCNLTGLALWDTQIVSVKGLSKLTNLVTLALQDSKVLKIDSLFRLKALEVLYLSGTPITSLPGWIGSLPKLKALDISNMKLHSIPKELLKLNLPFSNKNLSPVRKNVILLRNTTLATQPISLFEQPRELIQAYYDAKQIPINEAKVIFLGDGGAGKTHTIQRILNNGKKDKYITETTPGIEITNYYVEEEDLKFNIHFWDFGGQEIMHAMHRCFLTDRTCYVVVVSNRWDLNGRARYWLKNIDSFAKGAPVLLAINRWDNIQEIGVDMNRLTKDYPNLVKQPVYYSAKDSTDSEFQLLIDAIIREASKLDSVAMSFPVQWASIRQQLLDMAESRHYIDKEEYHQICDQQGLASPQIRAWLLEWFNDLGVCFSYHQDEADKNELAFYKVLNPRWLTNAIYIIINAGQHYADKGRMSLKLIQDLLKHSEFGVLPGVTYTENERDYVLDVMRKFNLSYSVSNDQEFIPALCESETPQDLHPTVYTKRTSYQMVYPYLPDSVVHQLMIRSYKNLNPEKIWRKGLRIDIEWFGLTAIVDMGNDDSTLRIDVYSNGTIEPWELLHSIRKDIIAINNILGLNAKEYIIIHAEGGDIPITVNELFAAKEQELNPLQIYNEFTGKWDKFRVDELLGLTFGEEVMTATVKKAKEENQSLVDAFSTIYIENITIHQLTAQPDASRILEYLIQHQCETNKKLLDCFINVLESTGNEEAKTLATDIKNDQQEKENFLKRIEEYIKPAANIVTSGKTICEGAAVVASAIKAAYPIIQEIIPQIEGLF